MSNKKANDSDTISATSENSIPSKYENYDFSETSENDSYSDGFNIDDVSSSSDDM